MANEELVGEEPIEQPVEQSEESAPSEGQEEVEESVEGESTEEAQPPQEKEKNSGFQKRINKITADKYRERNRADAAERELQELRSKPPAAPASTAPKLEDFDYDQDAFVSAQIKHEVSRQTQEFARESRAQQARAARQQSSQDFAKKVQESGISDYGEVINNLVESVPLPDILVDAIQQDDKGPEIAYFLGKNLDVADKLAGLSPMRSAVELGKISAALSTKKKPKLTKTPAPVKAIGSSSVSSGKSFDDMSMDEIAALDM